MATYETAQQYIDISSVYFNGSVLDIGGGGEGVISRHSGDKVVAIDIRKEELEETPDIGLKIIMDACDLKFLDASFGFVTCFFSLMYMSENEIKEFLKEAYRVLKPDGELWIWDVSIPPKTNSETFVVQLNVKITDDLLIKTGYGVLWTRSQSSGTLRDLCVKERLFTRSETHYDQSFLLRLCKA